MSRMIPANIDPHVKSNAEKQFFRIMQDMPETEDWTVFHSVALAKHPTQSQGETDFVVIIPGKGIFVLEIKGGTISYIDGQWHSRDRLGIDHAIKNPQTEANDAMHALIDYLYGADVFDREMRRVLFGYAVVFPDSEVKRALEIPDLAAEQIADITDIHDLHSFFHRLANFWKERKPQAITPNKKQCDKIVSLIRPSFVSQVSEKTIVTSLSSEILQLTENQQSVFDGLLENDRCLIKGNAGTGKTILAVNHAIRLGDEGKTVALFCYNRQLARYINGCIGGRANIFCDSFTDYMEGEVRKYDADWAPEKNDAYYREELPGRFVELLLNNDIHAFDVLILDESQDLLIPEYLDIFDLLLKDGLSEGCWYFFMDSSQQNIYNTAIDELAVKGLFKERKVYFANYTLRDNCRNSLSIIKQLDMWFGTSTRSLLKSEYSGETVIQAYNKQADEAKQLEKLLARLFSEGISADDIVILAPIRLEASCARLISDHVIVNADQYTGKGILFSTIQGFKGLEKPIVIMIDISNVFKDYDTKLLYVGATRSKAILYIYAARNAYKKLVSEGRLSHEEP